MQNAYNSIVHTWYQVPGTRFLRTKGNARLTILHPRALVGILRAAVRGALVFTAVQRLRGYRK